MRIIQIIPADGWAAEVIHFRKDGDGYTVVHYPLVAFALVEGQDGERFVMGVTPWAEDGSDLVDPESCHLISELRDCVPDRQMDAMCSGHRHERRPWAKGPSDAP